jgi:hypothetical protein
MVYRKISPNLKECALRLWELGWDEEAVIETLTVSQSSIYCWRATFLEFGCVKKPPSPLVGRTRIIV